MKKFIMLTAVLLTFSACGTDDSEPSENVIPPAQEEEPAVPEQEEIEEDVEEAEEVDDAKEENSDDQAADFEPQIEESIEIEGMSEPILLDLYDNEATPFITYVPTDFVAEEGNEEEGESYWFYTNYEGELNEDISLQIYLFPEGQTEEPSLEDGEGVFAEITAEMAPVDPEFAWYDWSVGEYQTEDGSDYVLLGEHEDQYFAMKIDSEPLYSGGFIPRVHKIIEHFYWRDTQEYLVE